MENSSAEAQARLAASTASRLSYKAKNQFEEPLELVSAQDAIQNMTGAINSLNLSYSPSNFTTNASKMSS